MSYGKYPVQPVFIVDDEQNSVASMEINLLSKGIDNFISCHDSRQVLSILETNDVSVMLLDLMMPFVSGEQILGEVAKRYPHIPVIVVTGNDSTDKAVACVQGGAFDFVVKPFEMERLLPSLNRAFEVYRLRRENRMLADQLCADKLRNPKAFAAIKTQNAGMMALFRYCEAIAEGQQPVLITGETGTGKELFAAALHRLRKKSGEFVVVNVAGLDDQTFSDALFGHVKGAYTGADRDRAGMVSKAEGGTIFLDEIGDLGEQAQIKLLRFLENREYFPLGADSPRVSNARVVVATNKAVGQAIEQGRFRQDLFFRLSTHHVHLPPLRERRDDIPLLLDSFNEMAAAEFGKTKPFLTPEAVLFLKGQPFPGNVRELKAIVYDAVGSNNGSKLEVNAFLQRRTDEQELRASPWSSSTYRDAWVETLQSLPTLKEASRSLIAEALRRTGNNQSHAATMLGITPQALSQRLKRDQE
jgi:DNA-binding NtrC family response regulator